MSQDVFLFLLLLLCFFPTKEEKNETFIVIYTDYPLSTGTSETPASSIVAAPHSGDGSFQMTSPPTEFPPQAALGGSPSASSFTAPDRIRWNGRTWRVVRVRDWQSFGYFQAYAVLMRE